MMMKIKLFFLLLVLYVSFMRVDGETKTCPPRQHFSKCGAGCQPNCEHRHVRQRCNPRKCVSGCVCDAGLILERKGSHSCVRKQDCESCPKTAYFSACGGKCQRTCKNYKEKHIVCPMICAPGCVCKTGYAFHNGRCIPTRQCPRH